VSIYLNDGGSITVGAPIVGGDSNTVVYCDSSGNIATSTDLAWNGTNFSINGVLVLQDTEAIDEGVIFKGGSAFLHNFHHPTGSTAVPQGFNIFLGIGAGNFSTGSTATDVTDASYNIGIGYYALHDVTVGNYNSCIGYKVLENITTGFQNSAVGESALNSLTTGGKNCAVGSDALRNISGSDSNIAIGVNAGRYYGAYVDGNASSEESIYIGETTRASANGNTNEIVIGHLALGNGSNTVTVGSSGYTGFYLPGDDYNIYLGASNDYSICWDGSDAVHTISAGGFKFTAGLISTYQSADSEGIRIYGYDDKVADYLRLGVSSAGSGTIYTTSGFTFSTPGSICFNSVGVTYDLSGNLLIRDADDSYAVRALWYSHNGNLIFYSGAPRIQSDNTKLLLGAEGDASIYYDGSDMYFNSQEVGTGDFVFTGGNVGIHNTNPSYPLDILMSATDERGINIDGLTDYTGTGNTTAYALLFQRDLNCGNGTEPTNFIGRALNMNLKHTDGDLTNNNKSLRSTQDYITDTSTWSNTSGSTRSVNVRCFDAGIGGSPTISNDGAGTLLYMQRGFDSRLNGTPTFESTSGVNHWTTHGIYIDHDFSATLSSGSLTQRHYGGYFDVRGDTTGSSFGYGLYIAETSGFDLNYSFYNSASSNMHLANDNVKALFGNGNDASLYYDSADLIISSDDVGTGSCKINSLEIDKDGFIKPITSADAAAPNNSIYYSSDASKLVYKDSGGTVNNLY